MRIGFVVNSLNTKDGAGRFTFELTSNLKKQGHEVMILDSLIKIFKNIDIIHAVDGWPNGFYAIVLSLLKNKPVIITALGTYSVAPLYSTLRPFLFWIYRRAKAIIAISNYTAQEIHKVMPDLKIKIICPGINLDFWSKDTETDNNVLKLKPYILSIGALKPRKGYHNSIKAFSIAAKKFENLNYVIVGQGEESDYAAELKNIIKENNLENRVFFISSGIDDMRLLGFYRNADLFVLTPVEENHHFEGFGIVYLEAAASGLPIIATSNSGATSATKDGYNSILVPQNDPKAAADAMIRILSDEATKTKLKNNSRKLIKEFSWEKIVASYIKVYSEKI